MKALIFAALITVSAFAEVTPREMKQIRQDTRKVMMTVADERLEPKLLSVTIVSELGSRAKVRFTFVEDLYGKKTCTYYYELKSMKPLTSSLLCGF